MIGLKLHASKLGKNHMGFLNFLILKEKSFMWGIIISKSDFLICYYY